VTVPANTAWGSAVGTGITGLYSIPFPLYSQTHLTVETVSNNVPTTLNLGTDYTFTSWLPDNKGQVANPQITFTNPVAGGVEIVFLLFPPGTQLTAITNQFEFFPSLHEAEFDLLAQFTLMLLQWSGKSIKAPDWEYAGQTNQTMPPVAVRSLQLAGWDATGNLITYSLTTVPNTTPVSTFWTAILDLTTQALSLTALGFSTFFQTLISSASQAAFLTASGFSTFFQTIINSADQITLLSRLGVQCQSVQQSLPSATYDPLVPTNWFNGDGLLILTPAQNCDLKGLAVTQPSYSGVAIIQNAIFYNDSAFTLTLKNNDPATAGTGFIGNGGADYVIAAGHSVAVVYSNYATAWIIVA